MSSMEDSAITQYTNQTLISGYVQSVISKTCEIIDAVAVFYCEILSNPMWWNALIDNLYGERTDDAL